MKGEGPVGRRPLKQAVPDHGKGSPGGGLGRLEDEKDVPRKIVLPVRQQAGRPEKAGGVDVMAAGVHPARILRPPGVVPLLLHGKGVHVRPQQHRPPGLRSLQEGGNAASGDEPPWNTQGIEAFPNDPHGFLQVEIQLRTGVKPPADGDEIFKKGIFPIVFFFHSVHSPSAPPFYRKFPERENPPFRVDRPLGQRLQ